jgi:hypothetical protein
MFDLSRHSGTKPDQPNLTGGNKIDKAKTPGLYANRSAKECPFRVKSAVWTVGRLLLVFPEKRTFSESFGMS